MPVPGRQTTPDITWYTRNYENEDEIEESDRETTDFCFAWSLRVVDFFSCTITEVSPKTKSVFWTLSDPENVPSSAEWVGSNVWADVPQDLRRETCIRGSSPLTCADRGAYG